MEKRMWLTKEGNTLAVDAEAEEDNKKVLETLRVELKKDQILRCRGNLIDDDLAKAIDFQRHPEPVSTISSTVPFMSISLLERWISGHPGCICYSPDDNLESGVWVTLIGLDNTLANDGVTLSGIEKFRLRRLNSPSSHTALCEKLWFFRWANRSRAEPHAFYGLTARWLSLLEDGCETPHAVSETQYDRSYQAFIREGLTWLETHKEVLSMTWGDCFRSQKTPEDW